MVTKDDKEIPKDATKDKAGKQKEVKTGSTKTVKTDAPDHEDAEDAERHEDAAKTYGKTVGKAEDEDDQDIEKFRSWEAGERVLRTEERKIKVRTMIREREQSLIEEEQKIQLQALKELEREGKFGGV